MESVVFSIISMKPLWDYLYFLKFESERMKYYTLIKGAVARNWDHYTFWKPPTNPSAKPNLTLSSHFGKNVGLGEG